MPQGARDSATSCGNGYIVGPQTGNTTAFIPQGRRERVHVPYRRVSGTALESYWCDAFAGASFLNPLPKDHTEFVRSEAVALL